MVPIGTYVIPFLYWGEEAVHLGRGYLKEKKLANIKEKAERLSKKEKRKVELKRYIVLFC
jgi:hypothetical protein